jgi:hypothetical protein
LNYGDIQQPSHILYRQNPNCPGFTKRRKNEVLK